LTGTSSFLLVSMMVIISLMKPTGAFEYVAIKERQGRQGRPPENPRHFLPS
jgi:Na+/H+ antiporter NhaD/arsenite permease-like protein